MPRRDAGFTLVEVLVALVMSAMLLAVIFDGVATARSRSLIVAQRRAGLVLAREQLTRAAVSPYAAESARGISNGQRWQVDERIEARDPRGLLALVVIDVAVSTADGKPVVAFTERRIKALPQP